jgi:hypothetical protein
VLRHQEASGTITGKECPLLKFFITMLKTTKIGNPADTIFPKFHRIDLFLSVILVSADEPMNIQQTHTHHHHQWCPEPPPTWKYTFRLALSNGWTQIKPISFL